MKYNRIWAVLGMSCIIFGCSKSSGKNKKNGNSEDKPNASENPNSPEEALKKLSPFHLKQVEDWEANIVKSCSSNSIFTESDKFNQEINGKKKSWNNPESRLRLLWIDGVERRNLANPTRYLSLGPIVGPVSRQARKDMPSGRRSG